MFIMVEASFDQMLWKGDLDEVGKIISVVESAIPSALESDSFPVVEVFLPANLAWKVNFHRKFTFRVWKLYFPR